MPHLTPKLLTAASTLMGLVALVAIWRPWEREEETPMTPMPSSTNEHRRPAWYPNIVLKSHQSGPLLKWLQEPDITLLVKDNIANAAMPYVLNYAMRPEDTQNIFTHKEELLRIARDVAMPSTIRAAVARCLIYGSAFRDKKLSKVLSAPEECEMFGIVFAHLKPIDYVSAIELILDYGSHNKIDPGDLEAAIARNSNNTWAISRNEAEDARLLLQRRTREH